MEYDLGIDVGTTAVKAVAFVLGSPERTSVVREYPLLEPAPGHQVQDPATVVEAVLDALAECVAATAPAEVAAHRGRMGAGGAAAELWHDVRTRLWSSTPLRRLVLGPLEQLRLRARGVMFRPRPAR